jgi:hypothetical protein
MKVKVSEIKPNPKNPRIIKDDKFQKLVNSIKEFPEMLEKRPLVCYTDVDKKLVILGGNMRFKAAKEVGIKELSVVLADDWTEEQKAQFLIKDNLGYGEWDWNMIANEWDETNLNDWGLDIPNWKIGHELNDMNENELNMNQEFDPIGISSGVRRLIFLFDNDNDASEWFNKNHPNLKIEKTGIAWRVNLSTIIQ